MNSGEKPMSWSDYGILCCAHNKHYSYHERKLCILVQIWSNLQLQTESSVEENACYCS